MNPFKLLSAFLVLSTVFLATGAIILRWQNLVPVTLTFTTFLVIIVILAVAHFTWKENFPAATFGVILAVVSIIFNSLQPQHIDAILHPFTSTQMTILVASDLAGFYALPVLYIGYYLGRYRKLRTFSALTKIQSPIRD